ncbi:hypothetical protein [Mangrovivirga cuniculi]|uniref:Uncharacterized protein n=1 Tax=Mangrovivirga cuniculi TaxID=2715131 RepID=A0A4D7K4H9_9BACT|nr:hypothetical protein [Mangrovivirga cuniculi]QCK15734.1 hypothetical protein DCC35_13770 [Mangrovivirga cuniculi]
MTKTFLYISFIQIFFISFCNGQTSQSADTIKIKDFEFNSWFGHKKDSKSNHNYSLLGTGFFRTPRAENIDSLISTWIENHPNAKVIPVYTFGPTMNDDPNSKQTYCWVVNNSDTLNIYLVKKGAIPGGTMQRPKTWKEMSGKERKLYEDKPDEEVHVTDKEYQDFITKIKIAAEFARQNKIGIYDSQE